MGSRYPVKTFGWNQARLSDHSMEDLQALRRAVEEDPASANPQHATGQSIYLFTPEARRKLDAIAWAIATKLREKPRALTSTEPSA